MGSPLLVGAPPAPDIADLPPEPPPPAADTGDAPADPELSETTVRGLLQACAGLANAAANPAHLRDLWRFEDAELDLLAPALTRIAARTPALKAALLSGDWLTVAMVMGGYSARNITDWRQSRAELDRQAERHLDGGGGVPRPTPGPWASDHDGPGHGDAPAVRAGSAQGGHR